MPLQCVEAVYSDYIVNVVSDNAIRDVEEQHIVHLTVRDQMALLEALGALNQVNNK